MPPGTRGRESATKRLLSSLLRNVHCPPLCELLYLFSLVCACQRPLSCCGVTAASRRRGTATGGAAASFLAAKFCSSNIKVPPTLATLTHHGFLTVYCTCLLFLRLIIFGLNAGKTDENLSKYLARDNTPAQTSVGTVFLASSTELALADTVLASAGSGVALCCREIASWKKPHTGRDLSCYFEEYTRPLRHSATPGPGGDEGL